MSNKTLIDKNFKLSNKLADFIAKHPEETTKFPSGSTYVVISAKEIELNKINSKLIQKLVNQGKKVIKAEEQKSNKNEWKFSYLSG